MAETAVPHISERFAVQRELGRGGMATVYLAHDRTLDREVALKLLSPELSAALGAQRFEQEIRLTARLVHPGIVPLYDSGTSGRQLYYVMPHVAGETLRQRLAREGPLDPAAVLSIASDVAEALAYAHGQGLVHRDIKPENIFCYRGHALLADFGIAKATASVGGTGGLTSAGMILGTVAYMSPEQALGEADTDPRSDLYSLGCVLYELLTGTPPFVGPNPMAVLARQMSTPAPPVKARRPDVPDGLAAIVDQLLQKDREARPASAGALLEQLRAGSGAPAVAPAASPAPPFPPASQASPSQAAFYEARDYFHKAMHGGTGAREKLDLSIILYERALQLDPGNVNALVGLADSHLVLGVRGFVPYQEAAKRSTEYRHRAMAIDPDNPLLHTSTGTLFLYWEDDFDVAGRELARAVELGTQEADGHRLYGCWLKIAGRLDEALARMREAVRLGPKAPFMHVGLGDVLMALGRYDEAIGPLRAALRLNPRYDSALERLEMACDRAGRHEEALEARRSLLGMRGKVERLAMLDADVARDGYAAARRADLERDLAERLAEAQREDPFRDVTGSRQAADYIIITLAELGEWTQAMDWVERGYHRRPGRLRRVLTDLPYDRHGLAVDPRYARLLRTAGLEELL